MKESLSQEAARPGLSTGHTRVLVVDDDPAIGDVLQEGLEASIPGCTVDLAANGEEAMERVRRAMPDLIILDVRMPGKDGLQVLEEIRELSDVPVIMLTVSETSRERAMQLGANEFLLKPFDVRDLLASIRRFL